jgi:RHS repeat-associated protein
VGRQCPGDETVADALLRRYVFDPTTGQPVVQYEGTGTAATNRRYYSADERGSVISVSDSSGAALAINSYDEYGVPSFGALANQRFGYTGQMWLSQGSVHQMLYRAYGQALGRFNQTDPIGFGGGSANLYQYVLNDPVNLVDPLGLIIACVTGPGTIGGVVIPGSIVTSCSEVSFPFGGGSLGGGIGISGGGGSNDPGAGRGGERDVARDQDSKTPCPTGTRFNFGGGVSATGFLGIGGLAAGIGASVAIPTNSSGVPTLTGTQISISGSLTPLVGLGLFMGAGANYAMSTSSAAAGVVSGAATPVFQFGAGTGEGVEIARAINSDPADWAGAAGRLAAGLYGAIGQRFSGTLSTPPIGCQP